MEGEGVRLVGLGRGEDGWLEVFGYGRFWMIRWIKGAFFFSSGILVCCERDSRPARELELPFFFFPLSSQWTQTRQKESKIGLPVYISISTFRHIHSYFPLL